jgi:hypothetical protein
MRLADAGHIGYKEAEPEISEERRRIRESMQKHKEELLKDESIKPEVVLPMKEGAHESHEERRSLYLQEEEESESVEPPPPPAVTPEARQEIRTLEIIAAEKVKLDERDEKRRVRHEEIKKHIHRPPPKEEKEKPIKPKKKTPKVSNPEKAKKQEKLEEGKARQTKAEQRKKKEKK